LPPEPQAPSKKDIVMEALVQTRDNVKAAVNLLTGVPVDRSYVYEIKRKAAGTCQRRPASSADVGRSPTRRLRDIVASGSHLANPAERSRVT
jgi:hypothetical protein